MTPAQYVVCRQKAIERPFTGEYYFKNEDGTYKCELWCGLIHINNQILRELRLAELLGTDQGRVIA